MNHAIVMCWQMLQSGNIAAAEADRAVHTTIAFDAVPR
jgi:hypothetical protein